jgi:hypothetical protein
METQYHISFSYSTCADNPKDALETMLAAIAAGNGFYVEVYQDGGKSAILEGDISELGGNAP